MSQVANILKLFEEKVVKAVSFAKNIPGFRDLHLDDQASLIKSKLMLCLYMILLSLYCKLMSTNLFLVFILSLYTFTPGYFNAHPQKR